MKYINFESLNIINSLSSSQYDVLGGSTKDKIQINELFYDTLSTKYLGKEIGSINYINENTTYKFIRTKSLADYSFNINLNDEKLKNINPSCFVHMKLKENTIVLSKDGNIGEAALIGRDLDNYMISSAIYIVPVKKEYTYYLLAYLKHNYFKDQLELLTPKAATLRHSRDYFQYCYIPEPNVNKDFQLISELTHKIVKIEQLIIKLHQEGIELFENIFLINENENENIINIGELMSKKRLDSSIYGNKFIQLEKRLKEIGSNKVKNLGFKVSRGQNLQKSAIGDSVYSNKNMNGKLYYKLILPKYITTTGTLNKETFLGNKNSLMQLQDGNLIFGAEGFDKGRSYLFKEKFHGNSITNIHGIVVNHENETMNIILKFYLDFLRKIGYIDSFATGGNGGSFGTSLFDNLELPILSDSIKETLKNLYSNNKDGILDLEYQKNNLKQKLKVILDNSLK